MTHASSKAHQRGMDCQAHILGCSEPARGLTGRRRGGTEQPRSGPFWMLEVHSYRCCWIRMSCSLTELGILRCEMPQRCFRAAGRRCLGLQQGKDGSRNSDNIAANGLFETGFSFRMKRVAKGVISGSYR